MKEIETIGEAFSSIDYVHQCLIDKDKAMAFEAALKEKITPSTKILELGTGSGILSLIAARLGAKKITAVEFDPFIAMVAKQNIHNNNYESIIEVVKADARTISFPPTEKFDLIVMEMLCTGLIEEMQVDAINNLCKQNLITNETCVIPHAQETYVALSETDFNMHGFDMKMIKYLWARQMEYKTEPLSIYERLNSIEFTSPIAKKFNTGITFKITRDGIINSVLVSSRVLVNESGSITLGSTFSLNPIIAIPIEEKRVKEGQTASISINYIFGGGFQNFRAAFIS